VAVLIAGCHSSVPTPPTATNMVLAWQTNGNPGVSVCPAVSPTDCIQSVQITDVTTGVSYSVSPSAKQYVAPGSSDTFEARVTGYNHEGVAITSSYILATLQ
jgi:hypothetical protein